MKESDFGGSLDIITGQRPFHVGIFIGLLAGCYRADHKRRVSVT